MVFTLSDETVNSYGFRVKTEGIDMERFKANPVMLNQHENSTAAVLGRWKNISVTNEVLTAEPEFDDADPDAAKIKGKVDRGFIKGASVGIQFNENNVRIGEDGIPELTATELYEASICAVPSNANALSTVTLYKSEGVPLTDEEVKMCLSVFEKTNPKFQTTNMKKIPLSAIALMALGFKEQPTEDEVGKLNASIEKLKADFDAEKLARETLQGTLDGINTAQAEKLVTDAITAGKLTADVKAEFVKMAKDNYALAAKVIGSMPAKRSLGDEINNPNPKDVEKPKDLDAFQKMSLEKQLAFKQNYPQEYNALFA